jgi:hypothetical protein
VLTKLKPTPRAGIEEQYIMENTFFPSVVFYLGKYFLNYGVTEDNNAKLLNADLTKYSGTPRLEKLQVIHKFLPYKHTNGVKYIATKQGVISLATAKVIKDKRIIASVLNS